MGKPWFAHKRFGYGAGLPITWQGWAVLVGFLFCIWALLYFSPQLPPAAALIVRLGGIAVVIAAFVAVARAKTEGGWRWRNGE